MEKEGRDGRIRKCMEGYMRRWGEGEVEGTKIKINHGRKEKEKEAVELKDKDV